MHVPEFVKVLIVAASILMATLACGVTEAQERGLGQPVKNPGDSPEQRVALVIGNSKYENAPLANPVNDATDMAAILKKCGFAVTLKTDCDLRTMKAALDEFGRGIPKGGVALFFYAGHGMQSDGRNYLVPLGADPQGPADLEFECIDAGRVLGKLEDGGASLNIIILDACRSNPFARSWSRALPSGLATMEPPGGSILIYATGAGSIAQDGTERNGLFTGCLLKTIETAGTPVIEAFRMAASEVETKSGGKQQPLMSFTFNGNFTFVQGNTVNVTTTEPGTPAMTLPPPPTESLGGLQVRVNVANATVKVNGESHVASPGAPANIQLPPGKVTVEVSAEEYEPDSEEYEVKEGDWTKATFKLAKVMVVKPDEPRRRPTVSQGEPEPGDVRTFAGIEFCWIPRGRFLMGSELSADEVQRRFGLSTDIKGERGGTRLTYGSSGVSDFRDELPQHWVSISKGFWLGKYEVSNREYSKYDSSHDSGKTERGPNSKSHFLNNPDQPVVGMTLERAQGFVDWLNGQAIGNFRLPTEAEWEYACRAGTNSTVYWGDLDTSSGRFANVADDTARKSDLPDAGLLPGVGVQTVDNAVVTATCGSYKPNGWNLHDMIGNVQELCIDFTGRLYGEGDEVDPLWKQANKWVVARGGSYVSPRYACRAAFRGDTAVTSGPGNSFLLASGFRIVKESE